MTEIGRRLAPEPRRARRADPRRPDRRAGHRRAASRLLDDVADGRDAAGLRPPRAGHALATAERRPPGLSAKAIRGRSAAARTRCWPATAPTRSSSPPRCPDGGVGSVPRRRRRDDRGTAYRTFDGSAARRSTSTASPPSRSATGGDAADAHRAHASIRYPVRAVRRSRRRDGGGAAADHRIPRRHASSSVFR